MTDRTGRPAIERYLARPRSARIMAALDDIFFQSSATTSFAGPAERDAWVEHMLAAIDALAPDPAIDAALREYFEMAATHMINSH